MVAVAAIAAVALPLATYTVTLALFGLAHVVAELRYVDARFSPRLGASVRGGLAVLLVGVVGVRLLRLAGFLATEDSLHWEMAVIVGLIAVVLPSLLRRGIVYAAVGVVAGVALLIADRGDPITAFVVLGLLHNITPVGFLAECLRGRPRRQAMAVCAVVFGVIPLIIATGMPRMALAGAVVDDFSPFAVGSLSQHLYVYVPPAVTATPWAVHLFSAAVFLQCMHYAVVVGVLPQLDPRVWGRPASTLPWPGRGTLALITATLAGLLLAGFAWSFTDARSWYGVIASVHAWIELPLLLVALAVVGTPPTQARHSPDKNDKPLANAESSSPRRAPSSSNVA